LRERRAELARELAGEMTLASLDVKPRGAAIELEVILAGVGVEDIRKARRFVLDWIPRRIRPLVFEEIVLSLGGIVWDDDDWGDDLSNVNIAYDGAETWYLEWDTYTTARPSTTTCRAASARSSPTYPISGWRRPLGRSVTISRVFGYLATQEHRPRQRSFLCNVGNVKEEASVIDLRWLNVFSFNPFASIDCGTRPAESNLNPPGGFSPEKSDAGFAPEITCPNPLATSAFKPEITQGGGFFGGTSPFGISEAAQKLDGFSAVKESGIDMAAIKGNCVKESGIDDLAIKIAGMGMGPFAGMF
jgi:hypothetical protein